MPKYLLCVSFFVLYPAYAEWVLGGVVESVVDFTSVQLNYSGTVIVPTIFKMCAYRIFLIFVKSLRILILVKPSWNKRAIYKHMQRVCDTQITTDGSNRSICSRVTTQNRQRSGANYRYDWIAIAEVTWSYSHTSWRDHQTHPLSLCRRVAGKKKDDRSEALTFGIVNMTTSTQ